MEELSQTLTKALLQVQGEAETDILQCLLKESSWSKHIRDDIEKVVESKTEWAKKMLRNRGRTKWRLQGQVGLRQTTRELSS